MVISWFKVPLWIGTVLYQLLLNVSVSESSELLSKILFTIEFKIAHFFSINYISLVLYCLLSIEVFQHIVKKWWWYRQTYGPWLISNILVSVGGGDATRNNNKIPHVCKIFTTLLSTGRGPSSQWMEKGQKLKWL